MKKHAVEIFLLSIAFLLLLVVLIVPNQAANAYMTEQEWEKASPERGDEGEWEGGEAMEGGDGPEPGEGDDY